MIVDLHIHKVTGDESFPTPWRYWFTLDTPFGNLTDEGLCKSEDECVAVAEARTRRWLKDKEVARQTKTVRHLDWDLEPEQPES